MEGTTLVNIRLFKLTNYYVKTCINRPKKLFRLKCFYLRKSIFGG